MAKQHVLESSCDRCHKEVVTPFVRNPLRAQYDIPDGWIHIQANSKNTQEFAMDLCDECKSIVIEAAGRARTR